jgi:hypothetical protein
MIVATPNTMVANTFTKWFILERPSGPPSQRRKSCDLQTCISCKFGNTVCSARISLPSPFFFGLVVTTFRIFLK